MDPLAADERVIKTNIGVDHLIATARRIMRPYTLDVKEVAWWSVYEIDQRICDRFDNQSDEEGPPNVFIAGDACHTHSPKAGQGMNVSMQDAFNLGWKLASVIRGQARPAVLETYTSERQAAAQALIDFDRKFAKMFSARPNSGERAGEGSVDPSDLQSYFIKQGRFTAGVETHYQPTIISAEPRYQDLAKGLCIGRRFHSAPVVRLADARRVHLGHMFTADGRWRLLIFSDPLGRATRQLCDFLADAANSPIRRYTASAADGDSVIDVRAIFQADHRTLALQDLPQVLTPQKGRYGLRDYEKVFCSPVDDEPEIFELRGVDRKQGCIVIVRPDQYVSNILPLNAYDQIASFFDQFMIEHDHFNS